MDSSVLAQVIAAVKEAGRLLTDPNAVAEICAKSVTDYVTNVDVAVRPSSRPTRRPHPGRAVHGRGAGQRRPRPQWRHLDS